LEGVAGEEGGSWAELMKRVFGFDVLRCDSCDGRMRILCAVNPPEAIKKILDCRRDPRLFTPQYRAILPISLENSRIYRHF